ncbi:hypothetical protein TMEN_1067 [Trichophyton mentagrophytes]|nr:hypothetical protein TMEN_1067 [Trichophyton mentagrophytes]
MQGLMPMDFASAGLALAKTSHSSTSLFMHGVACQAAQRWSKVLIDADWPRPPDPWRNNNLTYGDKVKVP